MNKRLLLLFTMVFALCCHNVYALAVSKNTKSGQIKSTSGEIKKGTVVWDATTRTLSLNNAEIQGYLLIDHKDGINIDLNGENVIDHSKGLSSSEAILVNEGNLMVSSTCSGSLKVKGNQYGIRFLSEAASFTVVKHCSVEIIADLYAFYGYCAGKNTATLDVTFDNASFYTHPTKANYMHVPIKGAKSVTLKNCELVSPANYAFFDGDGYMYKLNSEQMGDNEIWDGDFQVKPRVALNYNAILDDPNALYSLTLKTFVGDFANLVAIGRALLDAGVDFNLMYSAPCLVLKNAKPNEVKALAEKLVAVGCSVSIEKTGYAPGVYFKHPGGSIYALPDGDVDYSPILGKVTYDAENAILTLNNASIDRSCLYIKNKDLTIELIGDNHIIGNQEDGALIVEGANLNIQSSCNGSLNLSNEGDYGLRHFDTNNHTITAKDCNVRIKSSTYPLNGTLTASNSEATLRIAIDHASFKVEVPAYSGSRKCVTGVKEITLKNSIPVTPANIHFKDNDGYLYYYTGNWEEKNWFGELEVRQAEMYGINICGKEVDETNCSNILGDYSVTYDPAENVLTLKNAHLNSDEYNLIRFNSKSKDAFTNYTITLKGENTLNGGTDEDRPCGISMDTKVNVTIQGPGSLKSYGPGFWIEEGRLTIEKEAEVTIPRLLSGTSQLTVDNATLCMEDAQCSGLEELEMKNGVSILTEGVSWNPDPKYMWFEGEDGQWYDGPITIGVANTNFQVELVNCGERKTSVIVVIREYIGLTVSEAKALVNLAPCVLVKGLSQKSAEDFAHALREAGATVEVTENSETGIISTTTTSGTQQPIIYDIQGQQLQSIPSGSARRIYIVNGKKVLR